MLRSFLAIASLSPVLTLPADDRPAPTPPPGYALEVTPRQTVSAAITYEIQTTRFEVTRWTAFLPEPPESPSQTGVKVAGTPAGKVIDEKSPLGRKVRMIDRQVANP